MKDFMSRYIDGEKFEDCLIPKNKDFLISVKKGEVYNLEDAKKIAQERCDYCKQLKDDYLNKHTSIQVKEIECILNDAKAQIMKQFFIEQLDKEKRGIEW